MRLVVLLRVRFFVALVLLANEASVRPTRFQTVGENWNWRTYLATEQKFCWTHSRARVRGAAMHHEREEYIFLLEALLCNFHSSFSRTIALAEVRRTEFVFDVLRLREGVKLFTTERARVVGSQDVGDSVTSEQVAKLVDHGSARQVRQVEDFDVSRVVVHHD